jgi:hypothetical protein
MIQLKATKKYLETLTEIEDFIFECTSSIEELEKFHDEHDRVKEFIKQNPNTPAPHPNTGDQSWPFGNGRYRLFIKVVNTKRTTTIYLLDLIDNRMLNKSFYPKNSMPTYDSDE